MRKFVIVPEVMTKVRSLSHLYGPGKLVFPAVLCVVSGCSPGWLVTCQLSEDGLHCGSTNLNQDSPSSIEGVEDEKPVRTFEKPFSRLEKASS